MKNVFFALAFMLVGTFAFANNSETIITEENVVSLNEMSKTELLEESVSLKCWAVKQWVKAKASEVSDDDELIDELADVVYELCEIAKDLDWI